MYSNQTSTWQKGETGEFKKINPRVPVFLTGSKWSKLLKFSDVYLALHEIISGMAAWAVVVILWLKWWSKTVLSNTLCQSLIFDIWLIYFSTEQLHPCTLNHVWYTGQVTINFCPTTFILSLWSKLQFGSVACVISVGNYIWIFLKAHMYTLNPSPIFYHYL